MDMKDQNVTKSTSQTRRKFLMRTGVGLVVASLPARSVWAGSGGIAQSIVASGHGSDFANGQCLRLRSSGWLGNQGNGSLNGTNQFPETNQLFVDVFGGAPFDLPTNHKPVSEITLADVLDTNGDLRGNRGQVNRFMAAVYMNAIYHNTHGIYFPILQNNPSFPNSDVFARYLWQLAHDNDTSLVAQELKDLVENKHPGSFQCT